MKVLFPGTFDPITYGHLDIIDRGLKIFDHVVIAVGHNIQKEPLLSSKERIELIQGLTRSQPQIEVIEFTGLLSHFAREQGIFSILRSLRTVPEFETELAQATANRELIPECETIFLVPDKRFQYISSTIVREIAQFGGDLTPFVPPIVLKQLQTKFPLKKPK